MNHAVTAHTGAFDTIADLILDAVEKFLSAEADFDGDLRLTGEKGNEASTALRLLAGFQDGIYMYQFDTPTGLRKTKNFNGKRTKTNSSNPGYEISRREGYMWVTPGCESTEISFLPVITLIIPN